MTEPNESRGDGARLSPERWAHVRALVEKGLTLAPDARADFLDATCQGDASLRDHVERLTAACERATSSWGFLARPAGELAVPMLAAAETAIAEVIARANGPPAAFCAALADRYVVGEELGHGGMATVYVAEDLRHQRRVAIKVLDPHLGAMLGAQRFLAEIRVTASLRHPNLVPLFDSGEAGGRLYYVMPLIDGATLRARLQQQRQLPVDEAVRIVSVIAVELDYAPRQGVVHRDLKPENILLQDGQPLVADFGISLAVSRSAAPRLAATGMSLGTPFYMSPEQAALDPAVDGRSDIYSLACVLYELLVGHPPFTGKSVDVVLAKVAGELPASVRTLRPSVPPNVEAALARALAKLPADRFATARAFADALVIVPVPVSAGEPTPTGWWRHRTRLLVGAAATAAVASVAWLSTRTPAAPVEVTQFPYHHLIDQAFSSAVTITPNGRALVYTGSAEAGRPIMVLPLNELSARPIAGTGGGSFPFVAPNGQRLVFLSGGTPGVQGSRPGVLETASITGVAATGAPHVWNYGNGAWIDDSTVVTATRSQGLVTLVPGRSSFAALTRADSARGEMHNAPLVLPSTRAVVFTVSNRGGPRLVAGTLAVASLDPRTDSVLSHVSLELPGLRAIAFVDGRLLYISADGRHIMAVRLDVKRWRVSGPPVSVLENERASLETASLANNGTLLYVRRPQTNAAVLVDSSGVARPGVANAEGPFMYPRLSPDGKRFAVQVTSARGWDVWVYDVATGKSMRLTTTGALHPTWTPDGDRIVYMTGNDGLMVQLADSGSIPRRIPGTEGAFGPSVTPDGESVVYQRRSPNGWSIWSASLNGDRAPRKVPDDAFANFMPAVSPDGQWLAYQSHATGRNEVYARPFAGPGQSVQISDSGGTEPAWSADGRRIYYRIRGAFKAASVTTPDLSITSRSELFRDAFDGAMPHRNYDVRPGGTGFLMISGGSSEAVVVLDWMTELRARLARAR